VHDFSRYSPAAKILALKMTGQVGPRTFDILMAAFHDVDNILTQEEHELQELPGIGPQRSHDIAEAYANLDKAQNIIDTLGASDTELVIRLDEDYPLSLQELNDPPLMLFYKGRLPGPDEKRVAIIGSQEVSVEGIAEAVDLGMRLAGEGVAVVGGLARGIDTAGHVGALKQHGVTYAVLPSGFNRIHPSENQPLAEEIIKAGGLVSEYLPDTPVSSGRLMSRNRLIVGLSQAVVVGEVSSESVGTLDAALCCHQLGKLLFVMVSERTYHYEKLAEYGAIPITSVDEYKMIVNSLV
jgi:DNA processing protein